MAAKITEKENFLMCIRGETPHWIPRYGMMPNPNSPGGYGIYGVSPSFLRGDRNPNGGKDIWGVEYAISEEAGGAAIPKNDKFILTDITKWRDVIKAPDLSGIDWETMAKNDLKNYDRNAYAVIMSIFPGFFQTLMAFMGFTEGLCAMYEEPEEVAALWDYLADFYCTIAEKCLDYYKPDVFNITDDTATAHNPFFSPEMYRRLLKPFQIRFTKAAVERGLPVEMHNCGRCEDVIEDWMDFNVHMWHPAQVMNDLKGIKKKYGNSLVMAGCWDSSGPVSWPSSTEEEIRQAVRDTLNTYAVGGGYVFVGGIMGKRDDPLTAQKREWIADEFNKMNATFYK
jgi:hypothetical protein